MATVRARRRALRLAVILPPLFFLTVFGYWRFLSSGACRRGVELVLGRALGARVTIGAHRLARPSEIELSDLEVDFLAGGISSGVRFSARKARARAARLVGLGPFKEVVLEDPEADLVEAGPSLMRLGTELDLFRRRGGRPGVGRIEFRNMAVAFRPTEKVYRVGGIDLGLDFTGGVLRISAGLGLLRIEGVESRALEEEKPEISFDVEIAKSKVVLRNLSVKGRSGWKVDGDIEVDLSGPVPVIEGELQLRDLKISRIYTPRAGITILDSTGESAAVRRTYRFGGTSDDLFISAETDVPEFTYEDTRLGLKSEGTTLKGLRREMRTSLADLLRGLLEEDAKVR